MDNQSPRRLYKYREFNVCNFNALVRDQLWFADPKSFNDPLDTQPSLDVDVDESALKGILSALIERRTSAEKISAARALKAKGSRLLERIESLSREEARRVIQTIEYNAKHPEADSNFLERELRSNIEEELVQRYDSGIVSLSERDDCPLLWSHYGDEHRGICIGYSVRDKEPRKPAKVEYKGNRQILASKVAAMLRGDENARKQVDEAVLLRKGEGWRYEQEWRLIGNQGLHDSPLELEEIIFGCRFEGIADLALFKTFESRKRPVEFQRMRVVRGNFDLEKRPVEFDGGDFIDFPRRSISPYEEFDDMTVDNPAGNP